MSGRHGYSKTGLENRRREHAAAFRQAHPVRARVRWAAKLVLFLGPFVAVLGFFSGLPVYDSTHPLSVVCHVEGAAVGTSGGGGVRGIRSPRQSYVRLSSPDCGYLLLTKGVTRDNQADIAASIDLGHRYRVTVGAGSFRLREVLAVLKVRPSVQHYERID